jgi:acyl dehydratase
MRIDPSVVGRRYPPHQVEVARGRLRFFAQATGQPDPVYTDVEAANRAGHRDLPVPPTFLFCLEMERPDPWSFVAELGIELSAILHGGQSFEYHSMAYARDRLTFATRLSGVYEKKGGALTFIERTTDITRDGAPVARMASTLVLRNGSEQ